MINAAASREPGARRLAIGDLERIVAIDSQYTGRSRRHYFERRLRAAERHPDDFVHVAVVRGGALRGYAMARLHRGEYGRDELVAVLDAIGVEQASREAGVGQDLMHAMTRALTACGARSIQSQADWTSHAMLHFFEASGFELAPRLVLERSVAELLTEAPDIS
jgi:L-amino acid N-acyltransferase YncA